MYKWYKKHDENNTDNLVAINYDWNKINKKMNNLEPFIKKNITYIGKLYENVYIILDDNKSNRKWLYIVIPTEKIYNSKPIIFADHYTFCIEATDTKNPIHFHSTTYFTEHDLFTAHVRDYFPDNIKNFPKIDYPDKPITKQIHQQNKPMIIDIMRKPWIQNIVSGGGKKTKLKQSNREIISDNFVRACTLIKMKHLNAFGLRKNNKIHWSCNIIPQGRQYDSVLKPAFYFELAENASEKEFQDKLSILILDTLS
jgi:hypothetical protein